MGCTLLVETVSTALGLPAAADPATLANLLRERRLLLVLDNCEQIVADAAQFATTLLERCPRIQILATSRQTLATPGEYVLDLRPLPEREAEQLFLERAAAVVPRWTPGADERAVLAQLCRDLDDLPLAIELAAAQCRSASRTREVQQRIVDWVATLAEQVDVELYGPSSRSWMERLDQDKDTIRAALRWSIDDPPTQLRIAVGMVWFWYRRGYTVEALRALEPLSALRAGAETETAAANPVAAASTPALPPSLPHSLRLRGAVGLMLLRYLAGDYVGLTRELDQARALVAVTGDDSARSYALATIGYFEAGSGQTDQALADARASLALAHELSSHQLASFALLTMGTAYLRTGDVEAAETSAERRYGTPTTAVTAGARSHPCGSCARPGSLAETSPGRRWPGWPASSLTRLATETSRPGSSASSAEPSCSFSSVGPSSAAELVGIAHHQGQRIGFAPEAMDPVETRHFSTEIRRAIDEQGLTAAYERGSSLEPDQAMVRVDELVGLALD